MFRQQAVQGCTVPFGEIHHVDVIRTPVPSGVGQSAPNSCSCSAADGHLTHKGKQVVGDAQRVFSNAAGLMGANGVEIAQASDPPRVRGNDVQVGQHLLHSGFAVAIGVDWRDRYGFKYRYGLGIATEGLAAADTQECGRDGAISPPVGSDCNSHSHPSTTMDFAQTRQQPSDRRNGSPHQFRTAPW